MENKKKNYLQYLWSQKDSLAAFVFLSFIIYELILNAPGRYSWICYGAAAIFFSGLVVLVIKTFIQDWIKYKNTND